MRDILSNYSIFFKNLILWIIVQFIVACIISFLPNSLFNPHGWPYKIRKWEKNGKIYKELFKVKNWKNKLPVGKPFNKSDIDLRELGKGLIFERKEQKVASIKAVGCFCFILCCDLTAKYDIV